MGLGTVGDLALVVLGFSLIIFIHELGHFMAARWAGIRVLAFALGFGPAVVSYRKGMGVRRGSSEPEYRRLLKEDSLIDQRAGGLAGVYERKTAGISPTEYRLNILPLGGYVKMLGQDDSDPGAVSREPDSFTSAPVYKRMVVISAGVAMNIVTAAILFIIVFSAGLKTEPARVGYVAPGSAATAAVATVDGKELIGLKAGDTILSVNGESAEAFKDISLAVAMSRNGSPIDVVVQRDGFAQPITFSAKPTVDPGSRMLALGIGPAFSGRVGEVDEKDRALRLERFRALGAPGVEPGMMLVDAAGQELEYAWLERAADQSGGRPFTTLWQRKDAAKGAAPVTAMLTPVVKLQDASVEGSEFDVSHLAGLTPLMAVRGVGDKSNAQKAGLKAGDVFVRLGDVQWPSLADGIRQLRSPGRESIRVTVLRDGELKDLGEVAVTAGRIGIDPTTTADTSNLVTRFPHGKVTVDGKVRAEPFAATIAEVPPGSRIVRVGERQTPTLREVRAAAQELVAAGLTRIPLTLVLPGPAQAAPAPGAEPKTTATFIQLEAADAAAVASLGWEPPLPQGYFEPVEIVLKRTSPIAAVGKGMEETKKMVLTTYLTFARLFQGSVKVEHLKGPIGIADVGTKLAGKGYIWLLFFMAAVSVNLAVVNFLPLPIVDGGHFCFLVWEQFTGKPVSAAVQNIAALAGLALIGAVFLMTTYNDLANLLGR